MGLRGLIWGYAAWRYSLITPATTGFRRTDRRSATFRVGCVSMFGAVGAAIDVACARCSGSGTRGVPGSGGVPRGSRSGPGAQRGAWAWGFIASSLGADMALGAAVSLIWRPRRAGWTNCLGAAALALPDPLMAAGAPLSVVMAAVGGGVRAEHVRGRLADRDPAAHPC
jgi:hypothetical protein